MVCVPGCPDDDDDGLYDDGDLVNSLAGWLLIAVGVLGIWGVAGSALSLDVNVVAGFVTVSVSSGLVCCTFGAERGVIWLLCAVAIFFGSHVGQ